MKLRLYGHHEDVKEADIVLSKLDFEDEKIEMYNAYMGACECPCCGQWYNLFGQSLIDPKYWYEDEDDYYSDMPEED